LALRGPPRCRAVNDNKFRGAVGSLLTAARHEHFSRGAVSNFEGHLRFSFGLFELDEERHPNHAHGDSLAVLGG
jgi:hypothetical protein